MTSRILPITILMALSCVCAIGAPIRLDGVYVATAYAQKGITASGQVVHRHVVAADPDVLPIGSRIKIEHAGRYSGEYVVADTGDKIQGHRLDIYLSSVKACKKFGVKPVKVKVVAVGDGTHAAAKEADKTVKKDVQTDIAKKTVGNAATEDDWAAKRAAEKTAATSTAANGSQTITQASPASTKTDH